MSSKFLKKNKFILLFIHDGMCARVCKSERDNSRRIWWGFALIIFLYHALIIF